MISTPTLAVIKNALASLCTHSTMDNLMQQYGFALDPWRIPFDRNKIDKASAYLDHADWLDVKTVRGLLDLITHIFVELDSRVVSQEDGHTALCMNEDAGRIMKVLREREAIKWTSKEFDISSLEGSAALGHTAKSIRRFGLAEVNQEAERVLSNVENDPGDAITSAKNLVESVCRHILAEFSITPSASTDIGELLKETLKHLGLLPDQVSDKAKGADAAKKVLRSMQAAVQGLAELRNLYGDPHGKGPGYRGLEPRHARLAATMAGAIATFVVETHQVQRGHRPG